MELAAWRDASLIWLIMWTLIAVAPVGVVLLFAVKGMHRLRQSVRKVLPVVQGKAQLVAETTDRASRKLVEPVIGAQARLAQVDSIRKAILRRKQA